MKKIALSIIVLTSIFAASCTKKIIKTPEPSVVVTPTTAEDPTPRPTRTPQGVHPIVKITRGACYGQCPSYNATINSDGTVEFVGFAWVESLGANRGVIDKKVLQSILDKAQEIDYIGMSNEYPTDGRDIPDLPTITTEITFGDMVKQVKDHFDSPASLQALEVMIDEAVRAVKYTPTEEKKK
jgi:hypothetical protein